MSGAGPVLVERPKPGVTVAVLNRPDRRNALNVPLLDALVDTVRRGDGDPGERVLIIRGAGRGFCSGLDLKEAMDLEMAERSARLVADMLRVVARSRRVTIAAVHGVAMAGGAGLMSACDLVVAAEGTKIGYPEVRRGLVGGLVMGLLRRQVGERRVRELLLLGEPIDAARAAEIGLVNRVVPEDRVVEEAMATARLALEAAPGAVGLTKRLMERLEPRHLEADLDVALDAHMEARRSEEAREGLQAFAEKRPPRWQVKEERKP